MRSGRKKKSMRSRRSRNSDYSNESESGDQTPDDSDVTYKGKLASEKAKAQRPGLYNMAFGGKGRSTSDSSSYDDGTVPSDECSRDVSTESSDYDDYDDDGWDGDLNADCMDTLFSRTLEQGIGLVQCKQSRRRAKGGNPQTSLPLPLQYMDHLVPTQSGLNSAMETMRSKGQEALAAKWNFNYGPLEEQILEQDEEFDGADLPVMYKSLFEAPSEVSSQDEEEPRGAYDGNQKEEQIALNNNEATIQGDQNQDRRIPSVFPNTSFPCEIVISEQPPDIGSDESFELTPLDKLSMDDCSPDEATSSLDREGTLRSSHFGLSTSQGTSTGRGSRRAIMTSSGFNNRTEYPFEDPDNLDGRIPSRSRHGLERIVNRDTYRTSSPRAVVPVNNNVTGSQRKNHTVLETLIDGTARGNRSFLQEELPSFDEGAAAHSGRKWTNFQTDGERNLSSAVPGQPGEQHDSKGTQRTGVRSIWLPGKKEQLEIVDQDCPSFDELNGVNKHKTIPRHMDFAARERDRQSPSGISISINTTSGISEISTYGLDGVDKSDKVVESDPMTVEREKSSPMGVHMVAAAAVALGVAAASAGAHTEAPKSELEMEETVPTARDGDAEQNKMDTMGTGALTKRSEVSEHSINDTDKKACPSETKVNTQREKEVLDAALSGAHEANGEGSSIGTGNGDEGYLDTDQDVEENTTVVGTNDLDQQASSEDKLDAEANDHFKGDGRVATAAALVVSNAIVGRAALNSEEENEEETTQASDGIELPYANSAASTTKASNSTCGGSTSRRSGRDRCPSFEESEDGGSFNNLVFDSQLAFPESAAGSSEIRGASVESPADPALENISSDSKRTSHCDPGNEAEVTEKEAEEEDDGHSSLNDSFLVETKESQEIATESHQDPSIDSVQKSYDEGEVDAAVQTKDHQNPAKMGSDNNVIAIASQAAAVTLIATSKDGAQQAQSDSHADDPSPVPTTAVSVDESEFDEQTFKSATGSNVENDAEEEVIKKKKVVSTPNVSSYTMETFARYCNSLAKDKNDKKVQEDEMTEPVEERAPVDEARNVDAVERSRSPDNVWGDDSNEEEDEESREEEEEQDYDGYDDIGDIPRIESDGRMESTYVSGMTTPHMTTISELEIPSNTTAITTDAPSLTTAPTYYTTDTPLASSPTMTTMTTTDDASSSMYYDHEQDEKRLKKAFFHTEGNDTLQFDDESSSNSVILRETARLERLEPTDIVQRLIEAIALLLSMLAVAVQQLAARLTNRGKTKSSTPTLLAYPSIPFERRHPDRQFTRRESLQDQARGQNRSDPNMICRTNEVGTCETYVVPGIHVEAHARRS